jgi:Ca2+-binding RTX toxin-like protein
MSLVINVRYDQSANSAPAAFKSVVNAAVHFFESRFLDPVTINIAVGYGEVAGHPLSAGALGQSYYYLNSYSYSQVASALALDATTPDDLTAIASLADVSSGNICLTQAQAKALGLLGGSTAIDGYVGFAAGNKFDYNNANGVTAGLYDLFGTVAHEISEVMGRTLLVGTTIGSIPNGYSLLDFFHYSAAGVRDFVGTRPGYFSIDAGVTNLDNFNTRSGGDFGDWATSAGGDAFRAFSSSGVVNAVSTTDLRELDVLGWDLASGPATSVEAITQPDLTTSGFGLTLSGSVTFQVNNTGTGSATSSTAGVFLSADRNITKADTLLAKTPTPALLPNGSDIETTPLHFSGNLKPGTYYLGVLADYNNQVAESNEVNNASNVLRVILGNYQDNLLTGTSKNDDMFGLGGNDTLRGGAGNDTLNGGPGHDLLVGGSGHDTFVFNAALNAKTNVDTIADFKPGVDTIALAHTVFRALAPGALPGDAFLVGARAQTPDQHVIYNPHNGALVYDSNGSAPGGWVLFAKLAHGLPLHATDFLIL